MDDVIEMEAGECVGRGIGNPDCETHLSQPVTAPVGQRQAVNKGKRSDDKRRKQETTTTSAFLPLAVAFPKNPPTMYASTL